MAEHLTIATRDTLGIATLMVRRGADGDALARACGQSLPAGPSATTVGARTIMGYGPSTWLVFQDDAAPDFAETLAGSVDGLAAVSDQSGAYVVFRMSGRDACRLLQRGCSVDLDPAVFRAGSVAVTVIAHIGVLIRQVTDDPSYDVCVFRSFAGSFRRWIDATSASL